jgi:serine/threonine-protein kinase HipA
MTSEPDRVYVWAWLPGAVDPVVAGVIEQRPGRCVFAYGRSYLARPDAIAIGPDLPLAPGLQEPPAGMTLAGTIADAGPDAWGRRVVASRAGTASDDDVSELGYLLGSGSDRIGGLDFQASADTYIPRMHEATLAEMAHAARLLEEGAPLSEQLVAALLHGTSIGGARPKVTLRDGDQHLIAKLSSTTDQHPVVRWEAAALELARRVGIRAADSWVGEAMGRDVLFVERFDRTTAGGRRMQVSAATILRLDPLIAARHASYHELADRVLAEFDSPVDTLHELFARIVFNILVSNTDDHARNHAAHWDGRSLSLTPAYDIEPRPRATQANQAMAIGRDGWRAARLAGCIERADIYRLDRDAAQAIVDAQVETIRSAWPEAADHARLTAADKATLWERIILPPYAFEPDDW